LNYYYYIDWKHLDSTNVTHYFDDQKLSSTNVFTYNFDNLLIKEHIKERSDLKLIRTSYSYPHDYISTDIYKTMVNDYHIISPIIDKEVYVNDILTDKIHTEYDNFGSYLYLPSIVSKLNTLSSTMEERLVYDSYTDNGRISEVHKTNDLSTCYIWGYNQTYPVVKIEGKAYNDIPITIRNNISNHEFLGETDYNNIKTDRDYLYGQLQSLLNDPNCMVTFYTYSPLIGITSETDQRGQTIFYEYDGFGRLVKILNNDGNILKTYEYKYSNQP